MSASIFPQSIMRKEKEEERGKTRRPRRPSSPLSSRAMAPATDDHPLPANHGAPKEGRPREGTSSTNDNCSPAAANKGCLWVMASVYHGRTSWADASARREEVHGYRRRWCAAAGKKEWGFETLSTVQSKVCRRTYVRKPANSESIRILPIKSLTASIFVTRCVALPGSFKQLTLQQTYVSPR